jgi:alpha-galactosidase/6-phospho-beta-glucosidase family protein
MDCSGCAAPQYLENALNDLYIMFRKTGTMIFSTEDDGLTHISKSNLNFCIDMELRGKDISDPEKLKQTSLKSIKERFDAFAELSRHPEQVNWNVSYVEDPLIGTDKTDVFIPILKALDGKETMRIVASRPNRGAIAGLPENAAVEYSMDICGNTITPVENLYIPSPYKGLIAALAEFQTLQADAIAQQDPALFAAALDAYPIHQFEPERKDFFRKMFDAYDDLDPMWRKSLDYLF